VTWSERGVIHDPQGKLTTAKPTADLRKELHELSQAICEGLISSGVHDRLRSAGHRFWGIAVSAAVDVPERLSFTYESLPMSLRISSNIRTIRIL
jgi:hypothetical protein